MFDMFKRAFGFAGGSSAQALFQTEEQLSQHIVDLVEAQAAKRGVPVERMAARMTIISTAAGALLAKHAGELDPANCEHCIIFTATQAILPSIIRSAFFHSKLPPPDVHVHGCTEGAQESRTLQ